MQFPFGSREVTFAVNFISERIRIAILVSVFPNVTDRSCVVIGFSYIQSTDVVHVWPPRFSRFTPKVRPQTASCFAQQQQYHFCCQGRTSRGSPPQCGGDINKTIALPCLSLSQPLHRLS